MSKDPVMDIAVYSIIGGGVMIATGLKRFITARKTQDTATSKIATASQGFVELQGYAWKNGTEITNIDGRKCVYYKITMEKLVSSGKNSRWETVATTEATDPFYILDETGVVSVVPTKFDFNIQNTISNWSKISINQREKILNLFLGYSNVMPSLNPSLFFSPSYRCTESYILLGSPIIAHGNLEYSQNMKSHSFDGSLKAFYSRILKYHTDKKRSLTLFDIDRDGEIDEDELRIGMHSAARATLNNANSNDSNAELKYFGVLQFHPQHRSFIADCHEHHLLKKIGSWNFFFIFGGAGLILLGIWLFIYYKR